LHSKASERCEEKSARVREHKRKAAEREREIKKEMGSNYVNVCRCASVCAVLRGGERVVKPRLRIYDIELEVRRTGPEVEANKI